MLQHERIAKKTCAILPTILRSLHLTTEGSKTAAVEEQAALKIWAATITMLREREQMLIEDAVGTVFGFAASA